MRRRSRNMPWWVGIVFALFMGGMLWLGIHVIRHQELSLLRQAGHDLEAVADLKVSGIHHWRLGQLAIGHSLSGDFAVARWVERHVLDPAATNAAAEALSWMEALVRHHQWRDVQLVDTNGAIRLATAPTRARVGDYGQRNIRQALDGARVVLSDLHTASVAPEPHMDLVIPLCDVADWTTGRRRPVAALFVRIDPRDYLFPFVQEWPTLSETSETLLVRRDGDDVLFLNQLRHISNTAMLLRLPLSRAELPAVRAVRGETGPVEGRDYRGREVLAATRPIPDTAWFLVAKVDRDEVLGPAHRLARLTLLAVGMLVLVCGGALIILWQRQSFAQALAAQRDELERKALAQHYDLLARYANDVILLADKGDRFVEANERALQVYGYSRADFLALTMEQLHPPELRADQAAPLQRMAAGVSEIYETVHCRKDGTRFPVEVSVRSIRIDGETYIQSIIRDISERRLMEEQLRQALKMEAVGQLAGGVAHDFNNILQAIVGFCELAEDNQSRGAGCQDELREIRLASQRASALTRQLLTFSKRSVVEPQRLDLNVHVRESMKMVRRVIGEHVKLEFAPGSGEAAVLADPVQLDQVLLNLCLNAADAMPDGGVIRIEIGGQELTDKDCGRYPWARPGPYVRMAVADTGHGMPPEVLQRLFEPFFTTKKGGKGTGLGLATVYGIVRQHGGIVHAYSEQGHGSVFRVYLPLTGEQPAAPAPATTCPVLTGNETVLLAEDEEAVRKAASSHLAAAGYQVIAAADGDEAIRILAARGNDIQLAILDVIMPGAGGHKVYDYIRAHTPHVRVLFVSGFTANAMHTDFIYREGLQLIEKPYTSDDLLRRIRLVLDAFS